MNNLLITTSWDDGSMQDLRLAELLTRYGMKGTFYVPNKFSKITGKFSEYISVLNENEIRKIAEHHEIGGHTVNHIPLTSLTYEEALREITENKVYLEKIISKKLLGFAYPQGLYNSEIKGWVKQSGYAYARTTKKLVFDTNFANLDNSDKFAMPVSIMCAPFPFRKIDSSHYYWSRLLDPIFGYGRALLSHPNLALHAYSWQAFMRASVNEAMRNGGYLHLYGHSWEIAKYDFWNELEKCFEYLSSLPNINFVTNSEVFDIK